MVVLLRLTLERERRGWSRAELARRARMHAADVGKLEAGKAYPYPAWRAKLARVLGVNADALFEAVSCEHERAAVSC